MRGAGQRAIDSWKFNDYETVATTSGAWSGNTPAMYYQIDEIFVSSATSDTTFDVSITGPDSETKFSTTGETGEYVAQLCIPARGVQTISIANASEDEAFTVKLLYH